MAIQNVGMDIINNPLSSKSHQFVLTITDYFSKWDEIISHKEVKAHDVLNFIKHHVIYHLDIHKWIINDNESQFLSQAFHQLCDKFCIQNITSTAYNL